MNIAPLARPFACSLTLVTRLLAHSPTNSRAHGKPYDSMSQNDLVFSHSASVLLMARVLWTDGKASAFFVSTDYSMHLHFSHFRLQFNLHLHFYWQW